MKKFMHMCIIAIVMIVVILSILVEIEASTPRY